MAAPRRAGVDGGAALSNVLATILANVGDTEGGSVWQRIHALSVASWKRNLAGPFEHVQLGGHYPTAQDLFRRQYAWLHDLWHDGHNVLFADADTLAVRPVAMFGHFDEMRMFGLTNQSSPSRGCIEKGRYMNAAVLYLPQSMNPLLWKLGDELARQWPDDLWSYMQHIYNRMFWAQDNMAARDWWHPELNYQCPCANRHRGDDSNEGYPWWQARVFHFHSSRDASKALEAMRGVASWAVA